jgi:signal peptidase II
VVAAVVIAADQLTKTWALHHLQDSSRHVVGPAYFTLTYNSGAAFSLGRGITPIVETVAVALVVWLLALSRNLSRSASWPVAIGLGLLVGGALGNLSDRVFRHIPGHPGSVVDFIQAVSWWPVFNVADAAIVIGVIVLILAYTLRGTGAAPGTH